MGKGDGYFEKGVQPFRLDKRKKFHYMRSRYVPLFLSNNLFMWMFFCNFQYGIITPIASHNKLKLNNHERNFNNSSINHSNNKWLC